ncbi:carbohydrate esterase family 4 protein [Cucurbitaria berberidis CBS 394.84]|uniref:chitin deacetylase n=1 Tax=Cucurbitaria berberidis CBS 394.84 TaxID=1168544 RepID=A0A9P4GQR4_9PLEO|nr:carbohydrate esterase family 4 protein [Cucurbitaria berberidis CBS 394.84]KAF1849580.1 carbohydrate esterase family 4 protein [Cucurbitaria berberidis CBS 394.84]
MPRPSCRLFRLPTSRPRRHRLLTMFLALFTILTFITPFYIIYKPPHLLIRYFQRRWPDVLWHVPTHEKVVALTIDDAPSTHTQDIIQVLKENNATATFFVIGSQVRGREDALEDVVRAGHELGNHAMHDEPSRSLRPETLALELREVEGYINGTYTKLDLPRPRRRYFRPGSGFFSTRMRLQIQELGYRLVLGSVYPHDPQISYPEVNARHILSMVRPGSIIICHDRRSWTVPMLKKVLPELRRRGYRVTTVTGLLDAAAKNKAR